MSPKPRPRVPVSLRRVCPSASFVGCADIRILDATHRSDECRPGFLFAALPGSRVDGTTFVSDAVDRGAEAVLVERPLADVGVPQCVVPFVRRAYGEICSALHGNPSHRVDVVGVTGTNGKTTVTWMVRSILRRAGETCGLLGTVEYDDGRTVVASTLTTPDAPELSRNLAGVVRNGGRNAAIELSSHALDQDRAAGTRLRVAVVTNVTRDHFDYHGTFDEYLAAKSRIAELLEPNGLLVVNGDDPGATAIGREVAGGCDVRTFGLDGPADVDATIHHHDLGGSRIELHADGDSIDVHLPMPGQHNVSNALAAAAACRRLGIDLSTIAAGLEELDVVPGRLERVEIGRPFDVFVDYAHTPDALERVVRSLKRETTGRLICVFGAGGDRDRDKRPLLGRAAAEADVAIVTSDNPRSERPRRIVDDVLSGLAESRGAVETIVDRAEAIARAVEIAQPGDCVLVAGKGHERFQIVGDEKRPFDDRDVVRGVAVGRPDPNLVTGAVA